MLRHRSHVGGPLFARRLSLHAVAAGWHHRAEVSLFRASPVRKTRALLIVA